MGRKRHAVGDPDAESAVYHSAGDPLLTALFEGDVEGARQLLKAGGCDVEVADQLGWRPLHRAAFGGFTGVVAALLERRADPSSADADGLQPLHIAAAGGHVDCCQLLLSARADPTAPEQYSGMSAQMYTLIQDGEAGKRMLEVLGAPDLASWAAWGDPLAMARHVASVDSAEEREALEGWWAEELSTMVCLPARGEGAGVEASPPSCPHGANADADAVADASTHAVGACTSSACAGVPACAGPEAQAGGGEVDGRRGSVEAAAGNSE